ncbi:hypothetical protein JCM30471_14950 [Desulfuromonas carbonis]
MKYILAVIVAVFLITIFCTSSRVFANQEKLTIKTFDDNERPVEGANVGVSFERNTSQGTQVSTVRGKTDDDGFFTALGSGNGFISVGVHKQGFYDTYYNYTFSEHGLDRWLPWNPVFNVHLRKIEKPVPMYARNTRHSIIEIPEINKDIGFDLVEFDWVIPYGSGTHEDFIFHLNRRVIDRKDFDATLTITFLNKHDGIQLIHEDMENGSLFKLPRYAPEKGYNSELILREWRNSGDYNVKRNFDFLGSDVNYIFRVRSEEDDGLFKRGMYGKILGGIDFTAVHSKTAKIYFKYYLNPDYTNNLEFDPKENLFGLLPPMEQVGVK